MADNKSFVTLGQHNTDLGNYYNKTTMDTKLNAKQNLVNYSTSEVDTGNKWIDGKSIYRFISTFAEISASNSTWTTLPNCPNNIKTVIYSIGIGASLASFPISVDGTNKKFMHFRSPTGFLTGYIIEYTKTA